MSYFPRRPATIGLRHRPAYLVTGVACFAFAIYIFLGSYSIGPRMLEITLPHVDAWNAYFVWFGNSVEGYLPLRERVDAACMAVGRDPATVERTLALLVSFPGAIGRPAGREEGPPPTPIAGQDPGALAATLRRFAEAGVAHVQLVLDPITVETIAALEPMLAVLDA